MNVVTIDFDIIMKPSISFYNDMVDVENPLKDYVEEFSYLTNIPADLYIYDFISRYITKSMVGGCRNVYFINSHESAVDIIEKLPKDEEIHLYNIDHHHDLGYDMDDKDWIMPARKSDVGNWVKYCKDRRYIADYTWIHNDNSDPYPEEAKKYVKNDFDLKEVNLEDKDFIPDVLIICASFEWIPPVYQPLYLTWNSICSEIAGEEYPLDTK